jgi:hypothetical protein
MKMRAAAERSMPNSVVVPAAATLDRVEAHIRPIPNNTLNLEESEEVAALATTVEGSSREDSPEGAVEVAVVVVSALTLDLNMKGEEAWLPHPLPRPVSRMTLDLEGEEVAALATTVEGASLENSPTSDGPASVEVVVSAISLNLKGEEVPPRPAWLPHPLLPPVSPNLKGEEVPPRPARLPHPLIRPSHRHVPHAFPAALWEQRGRG